MPAWRRPTASCRGCKGSHDETSSLIDAQKKQLQDLEAALVAEREKRRLSEQKLVGLSKDFQSARTAEASARASLDAQNSNLGALDTSLKEERQRRSVLEAELKTRAQALDAAQKVEKEARAQASQATGQLQKLQESLRAEQHKTSALKDQLSAQLGGNSVAEATVKKLSDEIERLRAESIAVKKVREELTDANRKAMEAQAQFQKEKREKESLAARVHELESRPAAAAPGASPDEVEKLKADVASLKKKLVAAENAAEAAALLKSKVARLEAQLKKK